MPIIDKLLGIGKPSKNLKPVRKPESDAPMIEPDSKAKEHEVSVFRAEVTAAKKLGGPLKKQKNDVLPTRVDTFDNLIIARGFERGSTILISGGAGTGKTTFVMESLYKNALKGEKGIFVSFEEEPDKIIKHMKKNYGWDIEPLQEKGLLAVIKFDPMRVARSVEEAVAAETGTLRIKFKKLELPFVPDRIGLDSLSALSIAFETEDNYRKYIRELFETFEEYGAVTYAIGETEQDPTVYSRTGVEEFLADAVIVFYNIKKKGERENALEILKLRSSKHEKRIVPYCLTSDGFSIRC